MSKYIFEVGDQVQIGFNTAKYGDKLAGMKGYIECIWHKSKNVTAIFGVHIEGKPNPASARHVWWFEGTELLYLKDEKEKTMIDKDLLDSMRYAAVNRGLGFAYNDCYEKNQGNKFANSIKNVIFNDPATIVFWADGSKTVVKCGPDDIYDPEKGLAMAIVKKSMGNDNSFHKLFKKYCPEQHPKKSKKKKFIAGKHHKIVCASDCYHVKNIKQENRLYFNSLEEALEAGCRPCKHCNGTHKGDSK